MACSDKIKNYALITALSIISFFPSASNAQISLFPNYMDESANIVQVNTGQPFYRNGRAYYYTQPRVIQAPPPGGYVVYKEMRRDERRFCPPGQYKKGHCQKHWKRKNHWR